MLTIPMCKITVQHLKLNEVVGIVCVCASVCVHVYCLRVYFSFIQYPDDNVRIINTVGNVSEMCQLVGNFTGRTAK